MLINLNQCAFYIIQDGGQYSNQNINRAMYSKICSLESPSDTKLVIADKPLMNGLFDIFKMVDKMAAKIYKH